MAAPASQTEHQPRDGIFRNYSIQQASNYAEGRLGYSESLIDFVLNQHNSTGGGNGILLDVGCGPGPATRMLSPHFDIAYGADPGESMISKARELGGSSRSGATITYEVNSAEEIDQIDGLGPSSVDLITAATAAHWFEMPKFWKAAARLLKPGGSVAIWTVFKKSDAPSNNKLQAVFDDFKQNVLEAYTSPGSQLTHDGYVNLVMPWDDPVVASLYDRRLCVRHELIAKDGYLPKAHMRTAEADDVPLKEKLERFEKLIKSSGAVNRWQEAHPELVGTKEDIVNVLMAKIQEAAKDSGGSLDFSVLADQLAIAVIIVKKK